MLDASGCRILAEPRHARVWLLERHDYRTLVEARDQLLALATAVVR